MTEHFDVLIVGAGISGIGGGYHLQDQCPDKSFVILENQDSFGGTWKTHTYPGIRSDSDLYTFGYRFKPWTGVPIATAGEILTYLGEVIDENDLAKHIRYNHQVVRSSWSSDEQRWTVEAEVDGEAKTFTCQFLWMCQGYYRHRDPYTPDWPGFDRFQGEIAHPMDWPDDIDYSNKRVVVIGSGATAATLIPAMADDTEHITMLQRSPTFFASRPNVDELAAQLNELEIPQEWTHEIVRRKRLHESHLIQQMSNEHPDMVRDQLLDGIREIMGEDYPLEPHWTPSYRPWQQRIALVPNGDLFHAIKDGKVSVVTDHIKTFTETGIETESGEHLDADLIVTATGFHMNVLGDVDFTVDGEPMDFHQTITYRGTMFTGVPNMSWVFGYFRASWTLRADLIGDFVCRLLKHLDAKGVTSATPLLRPEDDGMALRPWIEEENFNPGYIKRALHLMPQQGDREPWRHAQDYWAEREELPKIDLDDGALHFA